MTDGPPFYPEAELERHGLTPDTFDTAAVYALDLDTPTFAMQFVERWREEYDVRSPEGLSSAIQGGYDVVYVGAAKHLRDRLSDHVNADVRRVTLLAVCPPTGIRDVWLQDSAALAFERERGIAMRYRNENPGLCVWSDGEVV